MFNRNTWFNSDQLAERAILLPIKRMIMNNYYGQYLDRLINEA